MTKPSPIYKAHDVVVLPFPYTDNMERSKRRPAVVLSDNVKFNGSTGQLICAMITSGRASKWPHDVKITNLEFAGLDKPCIIRMKLFTIDQRFILRKAGNLSKNDSRALARALKNVLSLNR